MLKTFKLVLPACETWRNAIVPRVFRITTTEKLAALQCNRRIKQNVQFGVSLTFCQRNEKVCSAP